VRNVILALMIDQRTSVLVLVKRANLAFVALQDDYVVIPRKEKAMKIDIYTPKKETEQPISFNSYPPLFLFQVCLYCRWLTVVKVPYFDKLSDLEPAVYTVYFIDDNTWEKCSSLKHCKTQDVPEGTIITLSF